MQTDASYERSLYRQNFINGVLDEMFPLLEDAPESEVEEILNRREQLKGILNKHFAPIQNYAERKMEWALDTLRIAMEAIEKQL